MTDLGLLVMHGDRRTASYDAGPRLLAALAAEAARRDLA